MPVIPQGSPDTTHVATQDTTHGVLHDTILARTGAQTAASAPPKDSARVQPIVSRLQTLLPPGRTDLPDSLYAERRGDTVVVHFDTSPARTRRADKFEHIVRQTLRAVYGAVADTLIAPVPDGRLAAPNELLTELPVRGIHLATADGRKIGIWPETRPGRDGPLVVAYRTVVER
jgi:hypothetical protein